MYQDSRESVKLCETVSVISRVPGKMPEIVREFRKVQEFQRECQSVSARARVSENSAMFQKDCPFQRECQSVSGFQRECHDVRDCVRDFKASRECQIVPERSVPERLPKRARVLEKMLESVKF